MPKLNTGITTVKKYKAEDGKEFDTYAECAKYQAGIKRRPAVDELVAGFTRESGIVALGVDGMAEFLIGNRDAILKALK